VGSIGGAVQLGMRQEVRGAVFWVPEHGYLQSHYREFSSQETGSVKEGHNLIDFNYKKMRSKDSNTSN
jgi:hypothetical protein